MSEQDRQALLDSGELVSLAQAAKVAPYSMEYLSLLARKGKLPAIKIARDWLTTRAAVVSYVARQRKKHESILKVLEKAERGML